MIVWHFAWIAGQFLLISRVSRSGTHHFKNHCQNIFGHGLQRKDRILLPAILCQDAVLKNNVMLIGDLFDELLKSMRRYEGSIYNLVLIIFDFTKSSNYCHQHHPQNWLYL